MKREINGAILQSNDSAKAMNGQNINSVIHKEQDTSEAEIVVAILTNGPNVYLCNIQQKQTNSVIQGTGYQISCNNGNWYQGTG